MMFQFLSLKQSIRADGGGMIAISDPLLATD
jgi:hypothetical protein